MLTITFPDIALNQSWPISILPTSEHVDYVAPTSLNEERLKTIEGFLQPFVKKEMQPPALLAFFYLYSSLFKTPPSNFHFFLRSSIPIGSGLGSSASISVCLATAFLVLGGRISPPKENVGQAAETLNLINTWAFIGEKCIHGNPSGVDNTVATFGGGVVFRKERRARKLSNGGFTPVQPAERYVIQLRSLSIHI
jgi:mevalonate kinase